MASLKLTTLDLSHPEKAILRRCQTPLSDKADLPKLLKRLNAIIDDKEESYRQCYFATQLLAKVTGKYERGAAPFPPRDSSTRQSSGRTKKTDSKKKAVTGKKVITKGKTTKKDKKEPTSKRKAVVRSKRKVVESSNKGSSKKTPASKAKKVRTRRSSKK